MRIVLFFGFVRGIKFYVTDDIMNARSRYDCGHDGIIMVEVCKCVLSTTTEDDNVCLTPSYLLSVTDDEFMFRLIAIVVGLIQDLEVVEDNFVGKEMYIEY